MAKETAHSGGLHEVSITKDDWKRWETEDTESTREFKESLRAWRGKKRNNKRDNRRRYSQRYYEPTHLDYENEEFVDSSVGSKNNTYKFRNKFYLYKQPLKNLLISIVLGIILLIIYSILEELNNITLIFIRLGSSLFMLGMFFFIKYLIKLYKNIRYFVMMQRKWFKWTVAIIILILLFSAYQNRNSLFDTAVKAYEETDFEKFSPFTVNLDDVLNESKSIDNEKKGIGKE